VYLRNKLPIKTLNQSTPYKCLYKKKSDVFYLRIIGLAIYCHEVERELGLNRKMKFKLRTRKCQLIKYGKGTT
jgi:hypothetical protein